MSKNRYDDERAPGTVALPLGVVPENDPGSLFLKDAVQGVVDLVQVTHGSFSNVT
jgi:hypothetical protein